MLTDLHVAYQNDHIVFSFMDGCAFKDGQALESNAQRVALQIQI
jgi:hypothetical protein